MMRAALIVVAIAAAFTAASCGRRGSPSMPPSAQDEPRAPIDSTDPLGPSAPDRPFVLDPILQ